MTPLSATGASTDRDPSLTQRAHIRRDGPHHALVLGHRDLVVAMAERYARRGGSRDDLVNEGYLGLLDAARRFDPDRGTRFATYARWWVRARMLEFLLATRRIVALPKTRAMRRLRLQLRPTERVLEQRYGGRVDGDELASVLGVTPEMIAAARGDMMRGDVPLAYDDPGAGYSPAAPDASPEERTEHAERDVRMRRMAERALDALDERERLIVRERLLNDETLSLRELSEQFGVSRERVRQLEARALRKMREALRRDAYPVE